MLALTGRAGAEGRIRILSPGVAGCFPLKAHFHCAVLAIALLIFFVWRASSCSVVGGGAAQDSLSENLLIC